MNSTEIRTGYLGVDGKITFDCTCKEYKDSGQCPHTVKELKLKKHD